MGRMRELIDRQALIAEYDRVHVGAPGGARKLMEEAPTIEERKRGKWIHSAQNRRAFVSDERVLCNLCGFTKSRVDGEILNFCQNCGADMRGERNDNN